MPTAQPATPAIMPVTAPVIVIAPDSFKGSLTARQVADAIGRGILQAIPDARLHFCPIADGGEGTLDAMLHAGGKTQMIKLRDASGRLREAPVAILPNGTAVIESAEIVGITDTHATTLPVGKRSTEGIGDAIRVLLDQGVRSFLIALGGSSTNDGGAGLLVGLGLKLLDSGGNELAPTPAAWDSLERVDAAQLDARLAEATLLAMSDVDNPLNGEHGATAIFGPQKGVTPAQVGLLDARLSTFADHLETALGRSGRHLPGAGAAGGLGYALHMLGAQFRPGAEVVAQGIGLDAALVGASWMITGEGRSDGQTLHGKAPFVACQRAHRAGVPATLLSGAIDTAALPRLSEHFAGCFSPAPGPIALEAAIANAAVLLADAAEQLTRLKFGPR
jgi:glycerate kinase